MGECHDIIFYQPLSPLMDKLNLTVDTMEDSYLLQRFIHENLARVTKIVGHVVDGIHRVTALDYLLTGTRTHNNEEEEKAIKNYGDRSPHQDKKVTMTIYTPQKIDEELLTFMKALSSRIQCSANKQTPHNIRDILCNEIKILAKKCDSDDDGVPHLWSCLGVVYNVMAGRILEMSGREINIMRKGIHRDSVEGQLLLNELEDLQGRTPVTGASMGRILEDYISFWVENMSQKIIHQLGHSSHRSEFQTLSSFDDEGDDERDERDESARRLFKHIYQVNNQTRSKFHIFPCKPTNMQINSFLGAEDDAFVRATRSTSDFSSVFKEDRYKRKEHKAVVFICCQVLLISRTCHSTQTCLTKLFSSLRPEFKQYTSAGYDDALRWTANFFHNVSDSVSKSYQPWKSAFFVSDKNHPVQCLPEQVIYLCLWGSAIEESAGFFSKLGMKAEWPGDLLRNRDEIEQALGYEWHSDIMSPSRVGEGGSGPDLLTYITISHALSLSRMGRGIRKQIQAERLSRSCGADIVRFPKARAPSRLSLDTIGGNHTADPRGKGGERLIKIVSHGTIVLICDQETHFTANIGQHYRLLLGGVDTAYFDALDSLNSIKEDDNMDDDNVSMVDVDVDSGSPLDVETEAHHAPLEDEEDVGIIENGEGDGGGGGVGILEVDIIDAGEGGGGGEGGEGGEGDDYNLTVVGGGEGGDDGGENENGGGGGEGGDDGGENENGGGGGGEARGNRRSSRVGGYPNPISGVGGGGGGGGPVSDSRRRRRRAGRGRQGPVSGTTSRRRRRRRRDGRRPRGGASAQPNDEIPEGATVENDNETLNSDESVVGKDAQVLAKSLEMMKNFDDLQVGLSLFNEYKGFLI